MAGFSEIQRRAGEWKAYNFPHQPHHHPVLGICEEVGELAEAYLTGDREKIADSMGDIGIYALNLCNNEETSFFLQIHDGNRRLHAGLIPVEDEPARMLLRVTAAAGRIAHAYLKREQGIRIHEDHTKNIEIAWGDLWVHLSLFAERFDLFLPAVVRQTWAQVVTRDWQKNAHTGTA